MDHKSGVTSNPLDLDLGKHKESISKLAQSGDAQKLMELLGQDGSVQDAASAAAGGNMAQLMGMVKRVMQSSEGAELVNRISNEAKKSGLK